MQKPANGQKLKTKGSQASEDLVSWWCRSWHQNNLPRGIHSYTLSLQMQLTSDGVSSTESCFKCSLLSSPARCRSCGFMEWPSVDQGLAPGSAEGAARPWFPQQPHTTGDPTSFRTFIFILVVGIGEDATFVASCCVDGFQLLQPLAQSTFFSAII